MSNLRKLLSSNEEDAHTPQSGSFEFVSPNIEQYVGAHQDIVSDFRTIKISGSYMDLAKHADRHFMGKLELKDSGRVSLESGESVILLAVTVVYANSTIPFDVELTIKGTDMPLMLATDGHTSEPYVASAEEQAIHQATQQNARGKVHRQYAMITRYIERRSYNAGQAYGFTFEKLKRAIPKADHVLLPRNYEFFDILFAVTEELLIKENGENGDHKTFATLSRQNSEYWKVPRHVLAETAAYVEQNIASQFKRITAGSLEWKLQRFTEKPWIAELGDGFDENQHIEFEAMIYVSFVIPDREQA